MVYNLPVHGELNYDTKLNSSIDSVKATADAAETPTGSQAKADAAKAFAIQRANHTGTQLLSTISDAGTAAAANTGTTAGTIPVLGTGGVLAVARLATGTPDGTKFVADDGTLKTPAGGSSVNLYPKAHGTYIGQSSITSFSQGTNGAMPSGQLWCELLHLSEVTIIDRMAMQVGTAGAAGSVVRMGIYNVGADGNASTLVLDAGTFAADTTGDKIVTVTSTTLQPGVYWMCAVSNDASGLLRVRCTTGTQATQTELLTPFGATAPASANAMACAVYYTGYTATSALPSTASLVGATQTVLNSAAFPELPIIYVRKAP